MKSSANKIRCAIYTRKSSEEGLEREFNSLQAQRESCLAYIASQRHEGWLALADRYDDAGVSGGTLDRPALQRLLQDVEAGRVDCVVVYKIDRLSRSITDFGRLVEVFDRHGVSFISVTQSFSTTSSMGRLTLNVLLSFAQYERELAGERIRDKFAASRRKGLWMGGWPPLGYDVRERRLVVNEPEAKLVRHVFARFAALGSATLLCAELNEQGHRTKRGRPFDKGVLYKLLHNRVYLGEATHKGQIYPGEHEAIIERRLWDRVHAIMDENRRERANRARVATPALLRGLIFGPDGRAMTPTHPRRRGRLYRYYVAQRVLKGDAAVGVGGIVRRVSAAEIEAAVVGQVRALLRQPEVVVGTWLAARTEAADLTEAEAR